jgi:predicted restriction endonuclease
MKIENAFYHFSLFPGHNGIGSQTPSQSLSLDWFSHLWSHTDGKSYRRGFSSPYEHLSNAQTFHYRVVSLFCVLLTSKTPQTQARGIRKKRRRGMKKIQ